MNGTLYTANSHLIADSLSTSIPKTLRHNISKLTAFNLVLSAHIMAATPNATTEPATANFGLRMLFPFEAVEAEGLGLVVDDIVEVDIADDDTMPTVNTIFK